MTSEKSRGSGGRQGSQGRKRSGRQGRAREQRGQRGAAAAQGRSRAHGGARGAGPSSSTSSSRQGSARVRLKCYCRGVIRVVTVGSSSSFRGLLGRLAEDFGLQAVPQLRYEDEDGDLIVLSCQNDLNEIVHHFAGGTAKVHLTPNPEEQQAVAHSALELPTPGASTRGALDPLPAAGGQQQQQQSGDSRSGHAAAATGSAESKDAAAGSETTSPSPEVAGGGRAGTGTVAAGLFVPGIGPRGGGGGVTKAAVAVASATPSSSAAVDLPGGSSVHFGAASRRRTGSPDATRPGFSRGSMLRSRNDSRRSGRAVRTIRRWQRGEKLGQGAFGEVYVGLDKDTGEIFAAKQIDEDEVGPSELSSMQHEITMLQRMDHDNIVRYLGTQKEGSTLSIFLEYVPGGSIRQLLNRFGALDEAVIRVYTRQLLLGLEYLHSAGIAHRDIKAGNLLVTNDGTVKVADFGASKRMQVASMKSASLLASPRPGTAGKRNRGGGGDSERSGSMQQGPIGTALFMAPEVIQQTQSGRGWRRADVWSVGCTVLEMATGRPPWSEYSNPVTAMYHIACTDAVPEPPESLSAEGKDFLRQCLQRDPGRRPDVTKLLLHPFVSKIPDASLRATSATLLHAFPQRPSTGHGRPATSLRGDSGWLGAMSPALGSRLAGSDADAFGLEQWAPVPPAGRLECSSPTSAAAGGRDASRGARVRAGSTGSGSGRNTRDEDEGVVDHAGELPQIVSGGPDRAEAEGEGIGLESAPGTASASDATSASSSVRRSPAADYMRVHGSPDSSVRTVLAPSSAEVEVEGSPADGDGSDSAAGEGEGDGVGALPSQGRRGRAKKRRGKMPSLFESLGFPLPDEEGTAGLS